MKLEIKLKNKNSCRGCPIYYSEGIAETGICPLLKTNIKFERDGTFYGNPLRCKKCIKKFGE